MPNVIVMLPNSCLRCMVNLVGGCAGLIVIILPVCSIESAVLKLVRLHKKYSVFFKEDDYIWKNVVLRGHL